MLEFLNPFEEKRHIYQSLSTQADQQRPADPQTPALDANTFDPEQVTQSVLKALAPRLSSPALTQEVSQQTQQFLEESCLIACRLLIEEPGYRPDGTAEWIPFDVPMARNTVELFVHGVFHASIKCENLGIFDEMKRILLEAVALDVFQQAKNIVVATMNQVETPEFQIPKNLQSDWIEQTANNALGYYLSQDGGATDGEEGPIGPESYEHFENNELMQNPMDSSSFNAPVPFRNQESREGAKDPSDTEASLPDATALVPLGHWIRLVRFLAEQEEGPKSKGKKKKSPQAGFQPEALAQEVTTIFYERLFDSLVQHNLDEDALQEVANNVFDFSVIAARFIKENILEDDGEATQAIKIEESDEATISFDLYTAKKTLILFAEGVFHVALKCQLMSIPGSIRQQLLKEVSYEIYLETLRISSPPADEPFTQPTALVVRTGPEAMNYFKRQVAWMKDKSETYFHHALTTQMNAWLGKQK